VEVTAASINWTGGSAIQLPMDYLRLGQGLAQNGDVDAALAEFAKADTTHPDYLDIQTQIAQIYLDQKNDPKTALSYYEKVAVAPVVKNLVSKRYSVFYVNIGNAYYQAANTLIESDKKSAMQLLAKAIKSLKVAQQNSRFFPTDIFNEALHDTYYYLALSYHKLFQLSGKSNAQAQALRAWQDYFDFFPQELADVASFRESQKAAQLYLDQLKSES
jgi:tetratricopeptide (TPR) repeat protein